MVIKDMFGGRLCMIKMEIKLAKKVFGVIIKMQLNFMETKDKTKFIVRSRRVGLAVSGRGIRRSIGREKF
jgi:hypothetical protein